MLDRRRTHGRMSGRRVLLAPDPKLGSGKGEGEERGRCAFYISAVCSYPHLAPLPRFPKVPRHIGRLQKLQTRLRDSCMHVTCRGMWMSLYVANVRCACPHLHCCRAVMKRDVSARRPLPPFCPDKRNPRPKQLDGRVLRVSVC